MFHLTGSCQLEKPTGTCDNCGHGIAQLFFIRDDESEKQMTVGSECVNHLLSGQETTSADLLRRRMQRAATQWRNHEPPARYGESRADYINRRAREMGNALRAYKAWAALPRTRTNLLAIEKRIFRMNNIIVPSSINDESYYIYRALHEMVLNVISKRQSDRVFRQIERKYNANRYDFINRSVWDVRKI